MRDFMGIERVLIANRAEVAIRIARACADLGIPAVAVFSEDDADSLHRVRADESRPLQGRGPAAYLDGDQMVRMAREAGCDAIHPGYGFLSESAAFAHKCAEASIEFVAPRPEVLEQLGDKSRAREIARAAGVPVLAGTGHLASASDARTFFDGLPPGNGMMLKAVAGGGGRGMRAVTSREEIDEAYERCASEAMAAFGNASVYAEQMLEPARHIEVQVAGDSAGGIAHLWERDCTLQRRHQKLIEIAPAPGLATDLREAIIGAALSIARAVRLDNLCTFEFLIDGAGAFYFIEANPRLQVEHTITEEVTRVDLVQAQIRLASGASVEVAGVADAVNRSPASWAVQARVYAERIDTAGAIVPSTGTITVCEVPTGSGVRVETHAYAGYRINPSFDGLIAKVIVQGNDYGLAIERLNRALAEFRIEGVDTNLGLLRAVLSQPDVAAARSTTRLIEQHLARFASDAAGAWSPASGALSEASLAGAKVDARDPLAVLDHGKSSAPSLGGLDPQLAHPDDPGIVRAPLQGTVIEMSVVTGQVVKKGERLCVLEAMKMEHVVSAPAGGTVERVNVAVGDAVFAGHPLISLQITDLEEEAAAEEQFADPDVIRPDLAEAIARHEIGLDAARADAVARRRKTGQRTARANIEDLCDDGSFVEYGPLVLAAQRRRRSMEELIEQTPADGLVAGIGTVNADMFGDSARCIAMSYDYTVLAGTQGAQNHRKKDRMFELAEKWRLPIVFFTEGGGGRPGDTDGLGVAGLDCMAFNYFGKLSGLVPLVGIVSGRCFAGNAALLGCCDVVIATNNANIGMGGPAMIEGGGLGVFRPEEVGPTTVQAPNGVIDVLVDDEAAATDAARRYLSFFQGTLPAWAEADQRRLRSVIPENRRRVYDIRAVIDALADEASVLELRRHFGAGMVTALARIEGRPVGIIANNPMHLAGAIDSDGADKAARFMQLCDAFDVPLLMLCDTPGIMVGPEIEKTALVRHASRMFVAGASVTVPIFTIVLRKAYGLGAQAMAGGSFKAPFFAVSWPTGEFGGMGLEGAVKLGYRNELAAIDDPERRKATFDEMVDRMYRHGKAVNTASHFEIDDVIDPADSRRWISAGLRAIPPSTPRIGKKRPFVDTW